MNMRALLLLVAAAALPASLSAQAPANDNFASAQVLSGNAGTVTGSNLSATGETGEPPHWNSNGSASSVWYRWTTSMAGSASIDTIGSSFDTVLAVYTGATLNALTKIAEDDESGGNNTSKVTLTVAAGTTYYVAVGSWSTTRGNITLNYSITSPPVITTQPTNQTGSIGGSATFSVTASGSGLSYQWFRKNVAITGATSATLALTNLQLSDGGNYFVTVSSTGGTVSSNVVTLSGSNPPPTISAQPQNLTVTVGQNATFTVAASGAGTLAYQWRRNGFNVSSATGASYTLSGASRADADYYDVVVADGLSVAISQPARLSVAPTSYATLIAPDPAWDLRPEGYSGSGQALASLPDGRCYLGGNFTSANGTRRTSVMRTLADGTLDPAFVPPEIDGTVRALAVQADGRVIVGGDFVRVNGALRNRLMRLNTDGSLDPTFGTSVGVNSTVLTLAVQSDGRVLVGGFFSAINGVNRSVFARLTADGAVDTTFQTLGFNSSVNAIAVQSDGKILVGGRFTTGYQDLSGVYTPRTRLARLNSDGTLDVAFNPSVNDSVNQAVVNAVVVQGDGKVVVGGNFTNANNTTVGNIARLNADGTLDTAFTTTSGAGFSSGVNALAIQADGKILAGGNFMQYAGTQTEYFARLNADGTRDTGLLMLGFAGTVNGIAVQASGKIVTCGYYFSYRDTSGSYFNRPGFARINADGTLDAGINFALLAYGEIHTTLALPGGKLLLAGYVNRLRGASVPMGVARINADGTVDSTFNPGGSGANSNVYAAARQADGKILIGGYLSAYNGTSRNGIARLNADGTLDAGFNAIGSGGYPVYTIVPLPGGRAFIGGGFSTFHGTSRNRVAVLNADGTLDVSFNPGTGASGSVYAAVAQADGKIIIVGSFSYNGSSAGNLVRLNPNGTLDATFNAGGSGTSGMVNTVALQPDGKLVIGGFFSSYNGTSRSGLARLNADGTLDPTFVPPSIFSVYSMLVQEDGKVVIRGAFSSVGGAAGTAYLARLNADGSRDASFAGAGFAPAFSVPMVFAMRDNGQFAFGSSNNLGFTSTQASSLPVITTQPQNQTAAVGGSTTFAVGATSPLPISFQWFRDGGAIPGATSVTLALTNLQPVHAGNYTVLVSNELGSVFSAAATLSGSGAAPVIATQPQSQNITAGTNLTLSVAATGGAFTYQWRRNGLSIAGATGSTLSLGSATRALADTYDVVVFNGLTSTVSQPAKIAVAPTAYPQVLSADPAFTAAFEAFGGSVQNFLRLSSGKVIVVGGFTRLGESSRRNIARLNADGTVDTTFVPQVIDGTINAAVVLGDGKLYIGGSFSSINGLGRSGLARLNADGSLDTAWAPSQSYQSLNALALESDGKLLVGGTSPGFSFLARVNADGTRDTAFAPAPNTSVSALALQSDGKILVGGAFTTIAGVSVSRLARLNADGTLDTSFSVGMGFNSDVRALRLLADGRVLVGGFFNAYNGTVANALVRLTAAGAIDSTWAPGTGVSGSVYGLELQGDGKILLGGSFSSYNGIGRSNFARLLADGALDTAFVPGAPNSQVNAVSYLNDGTHLIGGFFSGVGGQSAFGIARFAGDGSALVAGFTPGLMTAGSVNRVVALADGRLLAAGFFNRVNNLQVLHLARLNANGTLDPTFNVGGSGPFNSVNDLFVQGDGKIVISGSFINYNGVPRSRLARLHADGSLDTAFDPGGGPNSTITRIYPLSGGRVLLVGSLSFSSYNGVPRSAIARVNADGSLDASFNAGTPDSSITAAAIQPDDKLIIAGSFTNINGVTRNRIARLLPNGAVDTTFSADVDASINAVALQSDGKILIGGSFVAVNGVARTRVARLNADGSVDGNWDPGTAPNSTVTGFAVHEDGRIGIIGNFSSVNSRPNTAFAARLLANGALDTSIWLNVSAPPFSITMLDDGALLLSGSYLRFTDAQRYGLLRTASMPGPVFMAQPSGTIGLSAGSTFTFSTLVAGGSGIGYQWSKDGVAIAGANGSSYTLFQPQAGDAGAYAVVVSHSGGTLTSTAATVTVNASAPVLSSTAFISGFGGAIKSGSQIALIAPTLTAGTKPVSYQWTKDGVAISGATGAAFAPTTWQPANSGTYQVTITNSVGSVTPSSSFTQQVTDAPDWAWRFPLPQNNPLSSVNYLNGRFVALGAGGTVLTSTDGQAWTVTRLGVSESAPSLAFGNGTYVATFQSVSVFTSPDAVTWTRRPSGLGVDGRQFSSNPNALTFGGGRFVVVGAQGLVASSTDGITWTAAAAATTDNLASVAYGGGKFVALGSSGRTIVSTDGLNWSAGPLLPESVTHVAFGSGVFAAASGSYVYTSPEGTIWTRRNLPTTSTVRSLQYTAAGFLAPVSSLSGEFVMSTDGLAWTRKPIGFNLNSTPNAMTFGAGRYVIVGGAPDTLLTSSDTVTWTRTSPGTLTSFNFLAAAASSNSVVAVGTAGELYSSADGNAWTRRNSGTSNQLNDVTYASGIFVAVGGNGTIATSPDGAGWTYRSSGTSNTLRGVNYVGDHFSAVGDLGTILNSADGSTWVAATSGTTRNLFKSAFGAGSYVVTGSSGTVLTSTSGATWTAQTLSGINSDIRDVVFANGLFVLASTGASIRTSPDGLTWTSRTNPLSNGINALAYIDGKFHALPTGGTGYLTSTDGSTWVVAQHGCFNLLNDLVPFGGGMLGVGNAATVVSPQGPVITTHPASQIAATGASVTFTAAASGAGPFTYQWFKNGSAIAGATGASFTIPSVSSTDAGNYSVGISNSAGTSLSNAAALTVSSPVAPSITAHPQSQGVSEGASFTLNVGVAGTPPFTYQWRKDGIALGGATNATYTVGAAAASHAGSYSVVVTNSIGNATSNAATITLVPAGLNATHAVVGAGYSAGSTVTITNTITYTGTASALGWQVLLPPGWSYASGGGSEGDTKPSAGTTDLLEWAWTTIPASPVTFTYTLNVPTGQTGDKQLAALAIVRISGNAYQLLAQSDPLIVSQITTHSADTDRNFRISLFELTRVIELYNTRNGTSRTGCYKVQDGTEDGFAPEPTRTSTTTVTLAKYHSGDSNRDGKFSLLELTRVIELYNFRSGTTRTGQYRAQLGTEDGYSPGP